MYGYKHHDRVIAALHLLFGLIKVPVAPAVNIQLVQRKDVETVKALLRPAEKNRHGVVHVTDGPLAVADSHQVRAAFDGVLEYARPLLLVLDVRDVALDHDAVQFPGWRTVRRGEHVKHAVSSPVTKLIAHGTAVRQDGQLARPAGSVRPVQQPMAFTAPGLAVLALHGFVEIDYAVAGIHDVHLVIDHIEHFEKAPCGRITALPYARIVPGWLFIHPLNAHNRLAEYLLNFAFQHQQDGEAAAFSEAADLEAELRRNLLVFNPLASNRGCGQKFPQAAARRRVKAQNIVDRFSHHPPGGGGRRFSVRAHAPVGKKHLPPCVHNHHGFGE